MLVNVTQQSMNNKLIDEINKSRLFFNVVSQHPDIITQVPLVIKLDMQWLERGFTSPSGTIHAIGGLTDGIIGTKLIINKCTTCSQKKALEDKLARIKSNCLSIETPCTKCIELGKCRLKIFDVKKR